jgi:hypothetical protein
MVNFVLNEPWSIQTIFILNSQEMLWYLQKLLCSYSLTLSIVLPNLKDVNVSIQKLMSPVNLSLSIHHHKRDTKTNTYKG